MYGATLMKLSTVLETTSQAKGTDTSFKAVDEGPTTDDYTELESTMITKLQRRWRHILPRIQEARKFRQSPEGMVTESLVKLCTNCLPSDCPSSTKIAVRALLFTDGVKVLLELEEIQVTIQKLRVTWKALFESTTSTTKLEHLDSVLGSLGKCEEKVNSKRSPWSIKGLENCQILMHPRKLRKMVNNTVYLLREAKQELETISKELSNLRD